MRLDVEPDFLHVDVADASLMQRDLPTSSTRTPHGRPPRKTLPRPARGSPNSPTRRGYALRKLANQWKSKGVMPLVRADETGMDVENFLLDIDEALTTNRLVKVTFTEEDPAAKEAFAGRIAQMLRAHVVLVLGKTALLYRPGESCLSGAPGGLRDRGRRHRADPLGAPPETSAAAASSRDRAVIRCSRIAPGRAERV
ncbi:unnamed protein product [Prorocentrum cordatum]|uniref:CRM domain-containing protein n=1 Tax=Prorocentrum cordatum TaxID=2364126 RepID=A0ABN9RQ13_9DINO|nr:unnamed protein product [Polarella glacialis]